MGYKPLNSIKMDGFNYFLNIDPKYELKGVFDEIKYIEFNLDIHLLSYLEINNIIESQYMKNYFFKTYLSKIPLFRYLKLLIKKVNKSI